jgi:HPt (histidine-containing phosphotransfer) domain-containing protein
MVCGETEEERATRVWAETPTLDAAVLSQYRDFGGADDGPFLARLVSLYLDGQRDTLAALEAAFAAGDSAQARYLAHRLKGAAANVGACRLAALAADAERAAGAGESGGCAAEYAALCAEAAAVSTRLAALVSAGPDSPGQA